MSRTRLTSQEYYNIRAGFGNHGCHAKPPVFRRHLTHSSYFGSYEKSGSSNTLREVPGKLPNSLLALYCLSFIGSKKRRDS